MISNTYFRIYVLKTWSWGSFDELKLDGIGEWEIKDFSAIFEESFVYVSSVIENSILSGPHSRNIALYQSLSRFSNHLRNLRWYGK